MRHDRRQGRDGIDKITGWEQMKRRRNGEGSYGTVKKHGVVYKYYCAPGKEWTVYARTAAELEEKKKKREQEEKEKAKLSGEPLTVSVMWKRWLLSRKNDISPGTYDNYEDILTAMVDKFTGYDLGNKQCSGLTPDMLESYFFALSNKYSLNSINRAYTLLKQSIEYGQQNGLVPDNFSVKNVKKPTERNVAVKKKEVQFTTLSDMEILYREAYRKDDKGRNVYGDAARMLVFIMYSGVRVSEAIGLKWRYVKADYSEVRIMQSARKVAERDANGNAVMVDGHKKYSRVSKSTKTESGERTIPLPDRASDVLRYFAEAFPDHKSDDNVFLTSKGTLFLRENVERVLYRMQNNSDCSCKDYTPHSLRHGYGSILLSEGVDIKTVSVLLGHKDISTTYNIYIHVLEKDKVKAIRNVFNRRST